MEPIIGQGAADAEGLIVDTTTQTFARDVLEASRQVPVIVDFWAPWCGPCKQLTPILEKTVLAARGEVKLVKMNIDDHPAVAQQLRIQSIPAVYAFKNGQPVDGFMGALPESQVKAFIERLAGGLEPSPAEQLIEMAEEAFEARDLSRAAQGFAQAVQEEPGHPAAVAGLARCYIEAGDLDRARQTLALVRPDGKNDPAFTAAEAALSLAEKAAELGDVSELIERIKANPKDHQALRPGAGAECRRRTRTRGRGTSDHRRIRPQLERRGGAQAARRFFEAYGPKDEATLSGRRRLSSILFS